jgi:hypothetical protein
VNCLVRAALATPAYLSVAWALMVSYQVFTQTSVTTVVSALTPIAPILGNWLNARIDMVIFIYAFAWVFVLSSIIPQLILGKQRSVFVQFLVCLILTLMGFVLLDFLKDYGWDFSSPNAILANPYTQWFNNIYFAIFYLSMPYIFMLSIDLYARKQGKSKQNRIKQLTDEYFKRR